MSSSEDKRGRVGEPGNVNGAALRPDTKFKPKQSGNPGGRASYAKALEANKTTSAELLAELVEKALAWLRDNGNPKRAEYAHMWFTERILRIARPKETMDLNVSGPSPEQVALLEALKLTPYERRKVLEAQDSTAAEDADAGPPESDEAELPIE